PRLRPASCLAEINDVWDDGGMHRRSDRLGRAASMGRVGCRYGPVNLAQKATWPLNDSQTIWSICGSSTLPAMKSTVRPFTSAVASLTFLAAISAPMVSARAFCVSEASSWLANQKPATDSWARLPSCVLIWRVWI